MCKICEDKGWTIKVERIRQPRPAYWFNRGPNGEQPNVCTACNSIEGGQNDP